jgi:uncharacterized protein
MTSASAIWFHDRRGGVDWTCVIRLAPMVGLGALLGAWLAVLMPGSWLARFFAVVAAILGLRMLLANGREPIAAPTEHHSRVAGGCSGRSSARFRP